MGGRRLAALELSDGERSDLKALTSRRKTGQAVALRARIVLACAPLRCVHPRSCAALQSEARREAHRSDAR